MEEKFEIWEHGQNDADKKTILEQLRKKGGRVTKQREMLIDVILREDCTCCKELYYLVQKKDPGIGIATIYRTVSALEEIGVIQRKNAYCICSQKYVKAEKYRVDFSNESSIELDAEELNKVIEKGMKASGMLKNEDVKNVYIKQLCK